MGIIIIKLVYIFLMLFFLYLSHLPIDPHSQATLAQELHAPAQLCGSGPN